VGLAGPYVRALSFSLPVATVNYALKLYLSSQEVVLPLMCVSVSTTAVTPLANHAFMHTLGWGLMGSAVAANALEVGLLAPAAECRVVQPLRCSRHRLMVSD
jgi:Na+-driven multidrug efflux pump